nr:hypothetical protein [Methylomarinum sp. Ch1-1]MDP4523017.1 hypothetical protein [Methylomarinum sp. Ch1-1]
MITTYSSVFLALLIYGLKRTIAGIRHYFSSTESIKRKALFSQIRLLDQEQRHRLEKQQIHYRNDHRRNTLFRLNNRKHIRLLSRIDRRKPCFGARQDPRSRL